MTPIVLPRKISGEAIKLSSLPAVSGVPGTVARRGSSLVLLTISGLPFRKMFPVIPWPTRRVCESSSFRYIPCAATVFNVTLSS